MTMVQRYTGPIVRSLYPVNGLGASFMPTAAPAPAAPTFNAAASQSVPATGASFLNPATGQTTVVNAPNTYQTTTFNDGRQFLTTMRPPEVPQQPQPQRVTPATSVVPTYGPPAISLPPGQRATIQMPKSGPDYSQGSERVLKTEATLFAKPTPVQTGPVMRDPNKVPVTVVGPQTDSSFSPAQQPAVAPAPAAPTMPGGNLLTWVALASAAITLIKALR